MSNVQHLPSAKARLDQMLVRKGLVSTRSQAESYIKLGKVVVNKKLVKKPGVMVSEDDKIKLLVRDQYVSRAALKLQSIAKALNLDFKSKVVLDVGSSTGGFTEFALKHGARKVIAVEVGTNQMHPSLRGNPDIELHEQTDIRNVITQSPKSKVQSPKDKVVIEVPDTILIDVSFISLRDVLPHISKLMTYDSQLVAMVKPQFEAGNSSLKHKGVIKNDSIRRQILKDFETWAQKLFIVVGKADSEVAGEKGNQERFYLIKKLGNSN
jgi:23S rRNA (cytidine1920-2'-O)/16S rRNA (cytidine1409-2'-O)-methyltransferase